MSHSTLFHVFTPQRDQPAELEKILVKRHALIEAAVEKIRESVISPDKHRLLFIGPRGMGKSYLVTLIHHRLSLQEDLTEKMRFAWLNEDQTSTTFLHLLIRIYRRLADQNPEEFPISELDAIRGRDPVDAREMLGQSLIRHLKDRTVVLLIENLDAIFTSMSEIEQRTWRAFIQDHPCFAIVATAQGLTKDISSKVKPFFGFFDIHHLDPLTVDEAAELLEKIAALNEDQPLAEFISSPRGKARMRAIHHLSGGNPRLYLILSDFLTKDSLDNLVRLFEETVDRQLTPYFQERMRWLSPQQQEIVQFLCQQVQPASVKEISEGIFTKQNTVSSQLKQLRDKGYLVAKSRGKESLYELAEPLMRLSFQVKEMNHRQPLTLIVDFMRVWYDRPDLEKRLAGISPGAWGRDYFEVAIHKIDTEGNAFRHSLMLACIDDIDWEKCDRRRLDELRGIAEETNNPDAWFKYGGACIATEEYEKCIIALSCLIDVPAPSHSYLEQALFGRAVCNLKLNNIKKAIDDYTDAIGICDIKKGSILRLLYGRGKARWMDGDYDEAIKDLTRAINGWNENPEKMDDVESMANSLSIRGDCNFELGRYEEALFDWGSVVEMSEVSQNELANALARRAHLLDQMERYDEAMKDSERVVGMSEVSAGPLAQALNVRAICRMRNGDFIDAKKDLEVVFLIPQVPKVWLSNAYLFRSAIFRKNGEIQKAIDDLSSSASAHKLYAPYAFLVQSMLYLELHQYEQGLDAVIESLQYSDDSATLDGVAQSDLGTILVCCAYGLRKEAEKWLPKMSLIISLLVEVNFITGLSTALVRILEKLKDGELSNAALDRWVVDWQYVSHDNAELQIGIRLLRAGIDWIKTQDDDALLGLVNEERVVVRQALGLELEKIYDGNDG